MKIAFLSDLHGSHREWMENVGYKSEFLKCDLIIISGDLTYKGSEKEVIDFFNWFESLETDAKKVCIAGNHDRYLEVFKPKTTVTYLQDSGIEWKGLNIWGTPWVPRYKNWSFNKDENDLKKYFSLIPENTDILITHTPPKNILDFTLNNRNVGSESLLERLKDIKPKINVFGHIHEDRGTKIIDDTTYINASSLTVRYLPIHEPIIIEI